MDYSVYAGAGVIGTQDLKVRKFSASGAQEGFLDGSGAMVWDVQRSAGDAVTMEAGAGVRYFFGRNFGVQGEALFSRDSIKADLGGTPLGSFTMKQERLRLIPSLILRAPVRAFGLSSIYASYGWGFVLSKYTRIPTEWSLGGQLAVGADLLETRLGRLFVELKYLWQEDIGDDWQAPGYRLKTSGSPDRNLSNNISGAHFDTQLAALVLGLRFGR